MKSFYFLFFSLLIVNQSLYAQVPTMTCPGNTTVNNLTGFCGATVNYTAPVCATNCGGITIYQSDTTGLTSGDGFPLDTTLQEYTITNGTDSSICSFLIIVVDNENPSFSPACPGNITVDSDPGLCGTSTTYVRPKGIDNCGVPTTVQTDGTGLSAGSFFPVGVTTQTYVSTDTAGNIATCNFTVTVVDVEVPTIASCITPQTFNTDAGLCAGTAVYTMPTGADNCTNTTITQIDVSGLSSGDIFPIGSTFQEFSVTDDASNVGVATCSIEIIIVDGEDPVITCPADQTQFADANCEIAISDYTTFPTVVDNCDSNPTITQSPVAGTVVSSFTTQTITLTATDASGNFSDCTFDLLISDTISPSIICPPTQNVSATSACQATLGDYTGLAIMTDNCDSSPIASQNPASGTPITTSQIVTLTATDASGNTSTCTFLVTVDDAQAPTITCLPDETVYVDANCEYVLPDYTTSTIATDNCDSNPTITQSPVPGTALTGDVPQFISFTATDISGNASICSFLLTFIDTIAPAVICPSDQNDYVDANCEFSVLDYSSLVTGIDNCGGSVFLTQSPAELTIFTGTSSSPISITYTAQDVIGNTSTCSFNVNLTDSIDPVITSCANDTILTSDANCEYIMGDFTSFINGTDNCSTTLSTSQSIPIGTSFVAGGPYSIDLITSDDFNNTATCSFNITVTDLVAPTLICPSNPNVPTDNNCNYIIPSYDTTLNIIDNCSSFTYTQSVVAGTILSGIGTQQAISIFVVDLAGNTNSCSFTITIADSTAPTITCPGDTTLDLNANCQYIIPDFTGLVAVSDFCDASPSISQFPLAGEITTGINIVTFTASDVSGNLNTCTFNVLPNDTVAPIIICPNNDSSCNNTITYSAPIISDDCSSVTAMQTGDTTYSSGSSFPVGITTLEYTATDAIGNTATCTFDIKIFDPVVIFAGTSVLIEEGASTTIDASVTNGGNILWTPDFNIDDYTLLNPTVSPIESTFYVISTESSDGCTGIDSVLIAVNTIDSLEINNFISPNGDASNEYWTVNKPSLISGCWVSIYNRWGKLVWESESYDNDWNGVNKKGEPLPESTYFYVISCAGEEYKGSILLMR